MSVPGQMWGKVVLITGANSGIGKATATGLARMGATVVMACRDKERGATAAAEVRSTSGNLAVFLMQLDLASQKSVRMFAQQFSLRFQRPDVLINNAGVMLNKREFTKDKIVTTFAVNYLSHFLLTNLLLGRLKASAPSRIVNVTCSVHVEGHIDFRNLQVKKGYTQPKAYAQSKLAMVIFTYELARRLQGTGVTANCADPGDTETNLGPLGTGIMGIINRLTGSSAATPEEAAEASIYLASSPALVSVSGKYFAKRAEQESSAESYDEDEATRLWKESEKLAKLS